MLRSAQQRKWWFATHSSLKFAAGHPSKSGRKGHAIPAKVAKKIAASGRTRSRGGGKR